MLTVAHDVQINIDAGERSKMEPNDIELGDEVLDVERRPKAGAVVSVRLTPDETGRLQAIARSRHVTLSQVTREAITSYLSRAPVPMVAALTGTVNYGAGLHIYSSVAALSGTKGNRIRQSNQDNFLHLYS